MIDVVIDLLGSDTNEVMLFDGIIEALKEKDDLHIIAVGKNQELKTKIKNLGYLITRFDFIDAVDEITNHINPLDALKLKNSSMYLGLEYAKKHNASFITCGSTGSLLVLSSVLVGRNRKVRPALASLLQGANKQFILLDSGANIVCKSEHYLDFAYLGSSYMEARGIINPKCYLLSVGAEASKGTDVLKDAYQLLKSDKNINFLGNIEGNHLLESDADIILADGYSGNIALKTIEGSVKTIIDQLDDYMNKRKLNRLALQGFRKYTLDHFDYTDKGGAIMLGMNNLILKGHGAASAETIYNLINQAYNIIKSDLVTKTNKIFEDKYGKRDQ